jgi:hypothetical protein
MPKGAATVAGAGAIGAGAAGARDRAAGSGNRAANAQGRAENRGEYRSQLSDNAQTRQTQRQDWADGVRENSQARQDAFNEIKDDIGEPGWRLEYPNLAHGYFDYNHPHANGWWAVATTAALTGWWAGGGYGEPAYYDYGSGGNCYYDEEAVYVDGEAVATPEEYAQQAADIAETGAEQLAAPIAIEANEEWMSLGVFALSTSKEETNPTKYFQLAVNKDGVINGTFMNTATKQDHPILGAIDKKTQRASWYVGDKKDTVMETGVYNLTKDETSVLVHFGTERTEEYLLVRMDPPPEAAQPAAAPK